MTNRTDPLQDAAHRLAALRVRIAASQAATLAPAPSPVLERVNSELDAIDRYLSRAADRLDTGNVSGAVYSIASAETCIEMVNSLIAEPGAWEMETA